MPSLELSDDQTVVLRDQLELVVAELSEEIGATDGREYREQIKTRRRLLQEILEKLEA
jgi:hypothetical protein